MADASFLDWPFFDDAHRELAGRVERDIDALLADGIAAEHAAGHDHAALDRVARGFVGSLGAAGLLAACVPAEHGGLAPGRLDVRSICLLRDALARRSGLAEFCLAMQGLGTGPITLSGTPEQQARYLPAVGRGERIAAFAISETGAGSDPAAMAMTARRDGAGYVLDGEKTWISNAGIADHYVVFARTGEAPGAKGISAFVVDADTPGLAVTRRLDVTAPHPLGALTFTACRVPATALLGAPGEGFKIAMATLDVFRSTVGAAALGFARRALDLALDHAEARPIGGEPLAAKQLSLAAFADMALEIDAAALLVHRAAWTKDTTGRRVTREAAMAKLFATEMAQRVVDRAIQLHGGLGVLLGHPVERLYREVRALRIYEGASEVQKLIIAGQVRAARAAERDGGA